MGEPAFDFSLSVVVPVFNDQDVLPELHRRLLGVLPGLTTEWEIVFVDDGSADGSLKVLLGLRDEDPRVRVVALTRNFGQASALTAGLEHSEHDVVALMDSDLQDAPEDLERLLRARVAEDVPMAIARRASRKDGLLKRSASVLFQRVSNRITSIHLPARVGVFRVLRRELVDSLRQVPEKSATSLSLLSWMGHPSAFVEVDRDERFAGESGYTLAKMFGLAFDRVFSFSLFPIRLATYTGMLLGLASVVMAVYLTTRKLVGGMIVPGWTSIVVLVLLLFGVNFLFLGVIGEYLGRIFLEAKRRPRYLVGRIYDKR